MRARPLTVASILLLVGFAILVALALDWRQRKVAILSPGDPPAAALAEAGPVGAPGLLLWGDSRVAQWRPLPGRPFRIVAEGRPGASAVQLAPLLPDALARERPRAIVIQAGIEDAVAIALVRGADRPEARLETIRAFERMVADAEAAGADVILMRIVPPVRPDRLRRLVYRGVVLEEVARLNTALAITAEASGARLADPIAALTDGSGRIPHAFMRDALHFTPEAYAALDPLIPAALD